MEQVLELAAVAPLAAPRASPTGQAATPELELPSAPKMEFPPRRYLLWNQR